MKPKTVENLYNICIIGAFVGAVLYLYNFFGPHQPKATHISLAITGICGIILIVLAITKKNWDKQDSDQSAK
ncbi:MAG: hypothetical protein J5732_07315 [Bacteroidaceae bacterium]|nr:hypothetical protein [Bacteroidaceae bacterium]